MVNPEVVTVIPLATFLLANVPVAPEVTSVTASGLTTPDNAAEPVFKVAVVVPSYVLLLAVTPVIVSGIAVCPSANWLFVEPMVVNAVELTYGPLPEVALEVAAAPLSDLSITTVPAGAKPLAGMLIV